MTYTIVVSYEGPADIAGALVDDHPPTDKVTDVAWTCAPSGAAACAPAGFANITDYVKIPAGDSVTYTLTATVLGDATGALTNTASVQPAAGTTDPRLANNLAGDTDAISPACDLAVSIDDGVTQAAPGTTVVYSIVASNLGTTDASGARIQTVFPALLSCSWTGAGTAGTAAAAGPIEGDLLDDVNIPAGGQVTYTATCEIALASFAAIANTATIAPPEGMVDLVPSNNSDGDVDTLRDLDWGDAPNEPGLTYPVVAGQDGARHGVVPGFSLGALVDAEDDGLPGAQALGDDSSATDDEDGVTFTSVLATCEQASVTVNASAPGLLDAFVDFNADGDWADEGERIFASRPLVAGDNALTFTVPCGATPSSATFARFRFSSAGGLGPTGGAADGEVEDSAVQVFGTDFGDTPEPPYATLLASNGARHAVSNGKRRLRPAAALERELALSLNHNCASA